MRDILFAASAALLASQAHAEQLTVASWNLEHFTGADGMGCKPRTQDEYDEIRNIINAIDADVWLFQEIDTVGTLARVMDTSGWQFQMEKRPDHLPAGKCSAEDRDRTMQRTITAVKRRIPVSDTHDLSFIDVTGHGGLRHGVSVTVMLDSQPVEIVNVHLKAGCQEGSGGEACSTLFEQIPYLAAYAREQDAGGVPILIGGDFNRRLSAPGDAVMKRLASTPILGSRSFPTAASRSARSKAQRPSTTSSRQRRWRISPEMSMPTNTPSQAPSRNGLRTIARTSSGTRSDRPGVQMALPLPRKHQRAFRPCRRPGFS